MAVWGWCFLFLLMHQPCLRVNSRLESSLVLIKVCFEMVADNKEKKHYECDFLFWIYSRTRSDLWLLDSKIHLKCCSYIQWVIYINIISILSLFWFLYYSFLYFGGIKDKNLQNGKFWKEKYCEIIYYLFHLILTFFIIFYILINIFIRILFISYIYSLLKLSKTIKTGTLCVSR